MTVNKTFLTLKIGSIFALMAGGICLPVRAERVEIADNRQTDLQLRVVDKNRQPIANKLTDIYSDNGIDCVKEPCPNNKKHWQGRTDRQGIIVIPKQLIQAATSISIKGYSPAAISPQAGEKLTILLFPVAR